MLSSTSAVPPGGSIIAAATSQLAMIAYCGEVLVCIRKASLKRCRSSLRCCESWTSTWLAWLDTRQQLVRGLGREHKRFLGPGPLLLHGVVGAVEGVEGGVRQPGLVEVQRVDVAVDGLLDGLGVVDHAVVGRLGERDARLHRIGIHP